MVSIDNVSFEHDDAQLNCMIYLDIDSLVQKDSSEKWNKYTYAQWMCDNNITLKHCKHSEAYCISMMTRSNVRHNHADEINKSEIKYEIGKREAVDLA